MTIQPRLFFVLLCLAALTALTACGGGGDDPNAEPEKDSMPVTCYPQCTK